MSEAVKKNEEKKENLPRVNTSQLLESKKDADKLAGVLRLLGSCIIARSDEDLKSNIQNKVSKATKNLRVIKEDDANEMKKVKDAKNLTKKSWVNIKSCLLDDKEELSKDSNKLYNTLLEFGKSNSTLDLPEELF